MTKAGIFTEQEILSQPQAWKDTIDILKAQENEIAAFLKNKNFDQILFTGCGSTYYLSLAVAAYCQQLTGRIARGTPASEIWLNPGSCYLPDGKTLLVAVSRSGETTETLRACESFKTAGLGSIMTLSCYPDYPLSRLGDINLVFPSGQERSIAQTRAFTTLYLATIGMISILAERGDILKTMDELPALCETSLQSARPRAVRIGQDTHLDRFYFLGSGLRYGLASELSLKMKEMSLSQSEPFHFMEFRHGPKSMVTGKTLIIGLISRDNGNYENQVLNEMSALGATTFSLAPDGEEVAFPLDIPEVLVNALYLPPGQLLAFERSIARGLNPDEPYLLDAVVKLKS